MTEEELSTLIADPTKLASEIERGLVRTDMITPSGLPLLVYLSMLGDCCLVETVLSSCDPDTTGPNGITALMVSAAGGADDVVALLLGKGADVDRTSAEGFTALMLAASEGQHAVIVRLLAAGAQVDHCDERSFLVTPLFLASGRGDKSSVELLLAAGADPNHSTAKKGTPLNAAVEAQAVDCVRALVDHGAFANSRGADGKTPLEVALHRNDEALLSALQKSGHRERT